MDNIGQKFQCFEHKTHTFYTNSGIFINSPLTMDLALKRNINI